MFEKSGFEDEIRQSMEKQMVSNQLEKKYGFDKLSKAASLLNSAAELFDNAGMHSEANEVMNVLKSLGQIK